MARDKKKPKWTEPEKPWSILVVNPDPAASELLIRLLTARKMQVATAGNEHEAASALAKHEFHCCILDMGHGKQSAEHLKAATTIRGHEMAQVARVPLLVLSDTRTSEIFSWQNGVDGYMSRPYHIDELTAEIESIVTRPPSMRMEHRGTALQVAESRKTRPIPQHTGPKQIRL